MIRVISLVAILFFSSCSVLQNYLAAPSTLETISAVKEVMNSSAYRAIETLAKLNSEDGMMSLLPEEMAPVLNTLKTLGLSKEIDKTTQKIGEVSEIALMESKGIMSDAIKEVDLGDAVAIVTGGEDAATQVLREAMYGAVKKRYSAKLDNELDKTDVKQYWGQATTAYNLFAKEKIDQSLSDYMSEKAVDAVFLAMGKEETEIRKDPASLGKAVVTKVWDYYSKKNS